MSPVKQMEKSRFIVSVKQVSEPCNRDINSCRIFYFKESYLNYFAAAPKDRFLSFKVMPVMLETCTPPQILFSALGVVSPPPISAVLKQIRALTEVEGSLEHWTYKYGTIDQVFSALFSFLQGKFFIVRKRQFNIKQSRSLFISASSKFPKTIFPILALVSKRLSRKGQ